MGCGCPGALQRSMAMTSISPQATAWTRAPTGQLRRVFRQAAVCGWHRQCRSGEAQPHGRRLLECLQRFQPRLQRPGPRLCRRLPDPWTGQPDRRRQGRHSVQLEQGQPGETQLGSSLQPSLRRNVPAQWSEWPGRPRDGDRGESQLADCQSGSKPRLANARWQDVSHPWNAGLYGTREEWSRVSVGRESETESVQPRLRHKSHRVLPCPRHAGRLREPGRYAWRTTRSLLNGAVPNTGVVWAVYPIQGDANSKVVPGALVAYDATRLINGNQLKQLFHSEAKVADKMGNFAKYSTPVVANGRVYVGTFSNKVVQYGL